MLAVFVRQWRQKRKCWAECVNEVDPVTQCAVSALEIPFKLVINATRQYVLLEAVETARFILSSGKAINLVTQTELNVVELRRLDKLIAGKCDSVSANLAAAKERAREEHDRVQICQAMEVRPAEIWSLIMDAPFSIRPERTLALLPLLVEEYNVRFQEYYAVDRENALQFHTDNLNCLKDLNIETGDILLYSIVLSMVNRVECIEQDDEEEEEEEDEDEEDESESEDDDDEGNGNKRQRTE